MAPAFDIIYLDCLTILGRWRVIYAQRVVDHCRLAHLLCLNKNYYSVKLYLQALQYNHYKWKIIANFKKWLSCLIYKEPLLNSNVSFAFGTAELPPTTTTRKIGRSKQN